MSKISTISISFFMLIITSSCKWVDDDNSDCPNCPKGCMLELSYTYNILDAEAVSSQVGNAKVLIMDKNDSLLKTVCVDSLALHRNNFMIDMSSIPTGCYSFLVWCGIDDKLLKSIPSGVTLTRDPSQCVSGRVPSLFYGKTDVLPVNVADGYTIIPVSLVKDTKTLSCVLQSDNNEYINSTDFDICIKSKNGEIDMANNPADSLITTYRPFFSDTSNIEGFKTTIFGINSLRLMENDSTRFVLTYRPTAKIIVDIPLSKYLLLFKEVNRQKMSSQEYLDRQDSYDLIFFLTKSAEGYLCAKMQINGWIVRLNNTTL